MFKGRNDYHHNTQVKLPKLNLRVTQAGAEKVSKEYRTKVRNNLIQMKQQEMLRKLKSRKRGVHSRINSEVPEFEKLVFNTKNQSVYSFQKGFNPKCDLSRRIVILRKKIED